MTLTEDDLSQVRDVVASAIQELVLPRFDEHDRRFDQQDTPFEAFESRLAQLKADIKAVQIDMRQVKSALGKVESRSEALEADIKELYAMVSAPPYTDRNFGKLPVEQKILGMYGDFQLIAKEADVTLPR